MTTAEMLRTHPTQTSLDVDLVSRVIDSLVACAQTCTVCADACLAEDMVADLRRCIRLNQDCADVCTATAGVLTRNAADGGSEVLRAQLQTCLAACRACGEECASHAEMHEHCRVCAESCRECERACQELLTALG